jgi:hypothetical protein
MGPTARRAIPVALLGLLLVGVLTAGIAGQIVSPRAHTTAAAASATSSPGRWVATLLATTARAGTARVTYSQVNASPNPEMRDSIIGRGAVDFVTGAVRVSQVERQAGDVASGARQPHPGPAAFTPIAGTIATIGVGKAVYEEFAGHWLLLGLPRDPHAQLGLEFVGNASIALGGLEGLEPVASVRRLGPASLEGMPTTRYLVTNAPLLCGKTPAKNAGFEVQGPTTVWVDGHGRLVQARYTIDVGGNVPRGTPSSGLAVGPVTTTATLTLSRFGSPVTIAAPSDLITTGGTSSSFTIRGRCVGTM